jgi:TonB family protein
VSANRPDISQIRKYLKGELDARAMHELERQALDDPFLQDALDGYTQNREIDQQVNINDLSSRLKERINPPKKRVALWPAMGIAASVLVFIVAAGWWLVNNRAQVNRVGGPVKDNTIVALKPAAPATKQLPKPDSAVISERTIVTHKTAPKADNAISSRTPVTRPDNKWVSVPVPDSGTSTSIDYKPGLALAAREPLKDSVVASANLQAGNNQAIRIRGMSTARAVKPLYIVDGKIYNDELNKLNPQDIVNLSILKDNSASAIYGSRGANGVVIVTTKHGKAGKPFADSNKLAGIVLREFTAANHQSKRQKDSSMLNNGSIDQALQGRVAGVQVSRAKKQEPADSLKTIIGRVLSKDDGRPLPGVSVMVAGTNRVAQTDANGNFKIKASAKDELSVRYMGYLSKNYKVKNRDNLKVILEESHESLADVVVVSKATKAIKEAHPSSGWTDFYKYLNEEAGNADKAGAVRLSFIVNTDKSLSDFKILKSLNPEADQKAIDIIKNGAEWKPNSNGKPERIKVTIRFRK